MEYLNLIGLTLNVIGSLLFIDDTNKVSSTLNNVIIKISEHSGNYSGIIVQENATKLKLEVSSSKKRTRCGYFLFMVGFLLQIFELFIRVS